MGARLNVADERSNSIELVRLVASPHWLVQAPPRATLFRRWPQEREGLFG